MKYISTLALVAAFLTPWFAARAEAQGAEDQARQVLAEARAHEDEQRFALAAQTYMRLYVVMSEAGLPRASIALWSAGNAWGQVPGKEREAIDALRRFLVESTGLTDDPQVRDWRSTSVTLMAEFEARVGDAPAASEPRAGEPGLSGEPAQEVEPASRAHRISPVGPIVLGVGGAALVAGAVVGLVLVAENDSLVARCPEGRCPMEARVQAEDVQILALATDILLIGGALVAATGLTLTFVLYEEESSSNVAVEAQCGAGFAGCALVANGSF